MIRCVHVLVETDKDDVDIESYLRRLTECGIDFKIIKIKIHGREK